MQILTIEGKDLNNSKVFQNPDWELLESLSDKQLKDLRWSLEVELMQFQNELEYVIHWDEEPTECNNRTILGVEFDINYTLYKIDTVDTVFKRRVEARGEVYTEFYF